MFQLVFQMLMEQQLTPAITDIGIIQIKILIKNNRQIITMNLYST